MTERIMGPEILKEMQALFNSLDAEQRNALAIALGYYHNDYMCAWMRNAGKCQLKKGKVEVA